MASACSGSKVTTSDAPAHAVVPRDTVAVETAERMPEAATAPRPAVVTRLIEDALRTDGSLTHSELIRRLGPPRRTATEPIPNHFDIGRTDTIHTLTYRGLEAELYETTQPPRTFLIRLVLTSDRYHSPEGLRVGMRSARVMDRIGPPTERDPMTGEWMYTESETMPTALILRVRDGRITQIAWEFYFS